MLCCIRTCVLNAAFKTISYTASMNIVTAVANSIWLVWVDTALWLVLGLLFAGLAHVYLRTEMLHRWLGRPGMGSIWRAAVMGAPLPLCSCGVLPAAIGLRRAGASREATASFLISTPETGVDSVAVTYSLLGPAYAVLRPVAALMTAFSAGIAVWLWGGKDTAKAAEPVGTSACCGGAGAQSQPQSERPSLGEGLHYAFTKLLDDLSGWLIFGVALAGVMLALLPPELLAQFGQSNWALLLMLVVGVPIYVCAVASTPIAAALLVAGVSPGAVLVFLLAGPATNLGGLGLIRQEFGNRFVASYLAAICVVAITLGWVVNQFLPPAWFSVAVEQAHQHAGGLSLGVIAAIMLALWLLYLRLINVLKA